MFSWSPRQRVRIEHIDAEAEVLINHFGVEAYSEARRRELEASSDAIAEDWDRIALAVARKTGKRIGLDTATLMAVEADFGDPSDSAGPALEPRKVDPIDELKRLIGDRE
jgi:hypothetical protein